MAAHLRPTPPRDLSSVQRLDELTSLLAIGVSRILSLRLPSTVSPHPSILQICSDSGDIRLEVSADSRLDVPRG